MQVQGVGISMLHVDRKEDLLMASTSTSAQTRRSRQRAFTERDLHDLYRHKMEFCQRVLHLPRKKAREWAQEAVRTAREVG